MATDKMEHEYGETCLDPPGEGVVNAKPGTGCMLGTFQEKQNDADSRINHVVEVVGFGTDEKGNDYWHVRNSWGSSWGDAGYMKIVRDSNRGPLGVGNNLIETQCVAAKVHD